MGKKSAIDRLIARLKSELLFAEQHGKLNRRKTYWDGRVDSAWIALDAAQTAKRREVSDEKPADS